MGVGLILQGVTYKKDLNLVNKILQLYICDG